MFNGDNLKIERNYFRSNENLNSEQIALKYLKEQYPNFIVLPFIKGLIENLSNEICDIYSSFKSGKPDIIIIDKNLNIIKFVEVKSQMSNLSKPQKDWIKFYQNKYIIEELRIISRW